jgi:hypothetical protein
MANCDKMGKKCYYECEFCEEIFNNRMALWRHKKNKHNEEYVSSKHNKINQVEENTTSNQVLENLTNIILKQQDQINKLVEKQKDINEKRT